MIANESGHSGCCFAADGQLPISDAQHGSNSNIDEDDFEDDKDDDETTTIRMKRRYHNNPPKDKNRTELTETKTKKHRGETKTETRIHNQYIIVVDTQNETTQ